MIFVFESVRIVSGGARYRLQIWLKSWISPCSMPSVSW
jgi:hypothetical protein